MGEKVKNEKEVVEQKLPHDFSTLKGETRFERLFDVFVETLLSQWNPKVPAHMIVCVQDFINFVPLEINGPDSVQAVFIFLREFFLTHFLDVAYCILPVDVTQMTGDGKVEQQFPGLLMFGIAPGWFKYSFFRVIGEKEDSSCLQLELSGDRSSVMDDSNLFHSLFTELEAQIRERAH